MKINNSYPKKSSILISRKEIITYFQRNVPEIKSGEFRSWGEGEIVNVHIHDNIYQIDNFTDGEGTYTINGEKSPIDSNKFFVVIPKQKHAIISSKEKPLSGFSVKFKLQNINVKFLPSILCINNQIKQKAESVFRPLVSELVLKQDESALISSLKLVELILLLVRAYYEAQNKETKNFLIESSIKFMKNHFSESLTLADIATEVGVNPSYFCRVFKKESKHTPFGILREIRCEYVKDRLLQHAEKIYEIAKNAGFGSVQYMNRVFKSVVGQAPLAYRKANKLYQDVR